MAEHDDEARFYADIRELEERGLIVVSVATGRVWLTPEGARLFAPSAPSQAVVQPCR